MARSKNSEASAVESVEVSNIAETVTENSEKKKYTVKKDLDLNMIVPVKNGFQGHLVYKSRRTQEVFDWPSFGDEQDLDLQELRNAKNSSKAFFENNWFLIDDPEVLEYLGVSRYYKYSLKFDEFDEIFEKSIPEINKVLSQLNKGQKRSLAYRAKQLIEEGIIDSVKVINALEKGLQTELITR